MSVIGNFCLLQLLLSGIADFGNVTLGETVSLRHTPGDRRGIPDDRNQQPDHRWTTQHFRHDSLYRLRSGTSADILDERHKRTVFDRSGFSGKGGSDRANMSVIGNFCLLQLLLSGIADFGNVTLGETVSLRHTPGDRRGIPDDRNQQPDHRWTTQHFRHGSLYRLRSGTSADILDERHKRTVFDRSGFSGKGGSDRANMSVIGNFCILQVPTTFFMRCATMLRLNQVLAVRPHSSLLLTYSRSNVYPLMFAAKLTLRISSTRKRYASKPVRLISSAQCQDHTLRAALTLQ
ncbi:hypothetical protein ISCGN_027937 [Ixodes scapularis]